MQAERSSRATGLEHLRIARLLDAHGDVIGAICAYREVMRQGPEAAATEALLRISALVRGHSPRAGSG